VKVSLWATWDRETLHAIVEQQITSGEAAFCEQAPAPLRGWEPAELFELGIDPRVRGPVLKKCPDCLRLTHRVRDATARIRREIDGDSPMPEDSE
jgi:hypothetical protein